MTNDNNLYSGINSQTLNKRKDEQRERASIRAQLLPEGETVIKLINDMIAEMSHIKYTDIEKNLEDAQFKAKMLGNSFAIEKMVILRTRFSNLLRDNKDATKPEEESSDE